MRKLKLLLSALALTLGGVLSASAQASFNHTYTKGVTPAAGGDYFLYNIGTKQFLTSGLNYGTRATVDNSGRVLTLTENGSGYNIYTDFVSLNNRAENIRKAGYLTTNGYVDTGTSDAAWVFTPVEVAGYTNAYTIKNSDTQYLFFDVDNTDPGCPVNVGSNTGNNYSYWLLIPRATREQAGDYSHYLINTQMNACWEYKTWGGSTGWNDDAVVAIGGKASNRCGEKYHTVVDIFQDIAVTVPNGKYRLSAQGFYRQDDGKTQDAPDLYANTDKKVLGVLTGTDNSMDDASESFTAGKYADNFVETVVTNGTLRVGINITGANQWVIFDNFVLDYFGRCLVNDAVELPANGDMAANTWYYFDIAVAGDNYKATATTLGDIICISDGSTLTAEATTGDVTLKATDNSFAVGRYFVKSSSANKLVVEAASYTYTVGSAAADMAYIQKGYTVTVSYAALATNNPSADLTKNFSGVTLNGEALTVTPTDNGFTFEVPTVTAATDYTLAIPANAIGYAAGSTYNAAQNIILKTPAIFDGVYYMYDTDTKTYISRGGNYNTQAIMDYYGLAFKVSTDAENKTQLQYFDSELWLGDDGSCYGDCDATRRRFFNVTKVEGGYKFLNTNNTKYLAVNSGAVVGDADDGAVWSLESTAAHVANYTKNADAQAAAAASAASIDGITTKVALDAELASNYAAVPIEITGKKEEKWQTYPGNGQDSGPVTYYSEAVSLTPGLYKLSVDAFQRGASNARVAAADGARSLIYLYAGEAKTQLKSVMEYGADAAYTEGNNPDYENAGKHYPNSQEAAYTALATGNYKNEVYFYVATSGEVEIGIKNPTRPGNDCGTWAVYNNWTLTRYTNDIKTATITDAGWATLYTDKALDFSAVEGLTAYTASLSETTVTLTPVGDVPANTGVVLKGEAKAYNIPVIASSMTDPGHLMGSATEATAYNAFGDSYALYMLNKVDGLAQFVQVTSGSIAAGKAFLKVRKTSDGARPLTVVVEGETTAISNVNANVNLNDNVFDLQGRRVAQPTKGLYIVNGKKVVVK